MDPTWRHPVIRLTDLRGKEVRTLDGERLGRVHEVHCERGMVTALMVGAASFIERMTAQRKGRRVPWDCVRKMDSNGIVVTPEPPRRKKR
jgi:sporulation protein YlmC with PRC-barrel domain